MVTLFLITGISYGFVNYMVIHNEGVVQYWFINHSDGWKTYAWYIGLIGGTYLIY